jgi:hypothetical protein
VGAAAPEAPTRLQSLIKFCESHSEQDPDWSNTVKVRLIVPISGTRNGKDWPAVGGVVDLPNDEAAHMLNARQAEPVVDEAPVETAARATTPRKR